MKEQELEESIRTLNCMLGYLELVQSEIDGYISYLESIGAKQQV